MKKIFILSVFAFMAFFVNAQNQKLDSIQADEIVAKFLKGKVYVDTLNAPNELLTHYLTKKGDTKMIVSLTKYGVSVTCIPCKLRSEIAFAKIGEHYYAFYGKGKINDLNEVFDEFLTVLEK